MNSCESVQDKTAELQVDYKNLLDKINETAGLTLNMYTNNLVYAANIYANGYVKHNIILWRESKFLSA